MTPRYFFLVATFFSAFSAFSGLASSFDAALSFFKTSSYAFAVSQT